MPNSNAFLKKLKKNQCNVSSLIKVANERLSQKGIGEGELIYWVHTKGQALCWEFYIFYLIPHTTTSSYSLTKEKN